MNAKQRAEESKKPGEGVDVDHLDVVREIGAESLGWSDMKLDEVIFELMNSTREEIE